MKRAAILLAMTLGLAGTATTASATPQPEAIGFWLDQVQGWVVETQFCDSGLCGFLVGFRKTRSEDYVARDARNPDPKKRDVPLCGLMLLGGFTPSKDVDKKWENGWVYDPDTGATYTGEAQVIDADTVKLRGYVMIPLFGRTLTLVREVVAGNRCSVPPTDRQAGLAGNGVELKTVPTETAVQVNYSRTRRP